MQTLNKTMAQAIPFTLPMQKDGHYYIVEGYEDIFGHILSSTTHTVNKESYKAVKRAQHLERNSQLYGALVDFLVTTAVRKLSIKGGYHLWKGIGRSLR